VKPFYIEACGMRLTHSEDDHVVLESAAFQLVIVAVPKSIAAPIQVATPPARREDTPIKLVFRVGSIDAVREAVARLGGELNPPGREWSFQGCRVCDGHDPEGNVVQFREAASRDAQG
jgi:predicted enzyme related to lactoylglutathione lyase